VSSANRPIRQTTKIRPSTEHKIGGVTDDRRLRGA
jgi:hypothetical protein